MPGIFARLPSNLRVIAERRLREEVVGQICEDFDDVRAALDHLEVMRDAATDNLGDATDSHYYHLIKLQEQLPMELIEIRDKTKT